MLIRLYNSLAAVLLVFFVLSICVAAPQFCGDFGTVYSAVDFNKDCRVDLKDFAIYASMWLGNEYEAVDDNHAIFKDIDIEWIREHIDDFELPALPNQSQEAVIEITPGDDIQAAIDQLSANGGGVVLLLKGNHYVSDTIYLKSDITLKGKGAESVIKREEQSELRHIVFTPGGISDVVIKDLKIDGARSREQRRWTWDEDSSDGWPRGLFILDDNGQRNSRVAVVRVHITRNAIGFHSKGTDDLIVSGVKSYDNGGVDMYFHNGYLRRNERVLITGSEFTDSHTGNGLNLTLQRNIIVIGCIFGDNHFRGLRAANTENMVWQNNKSYGNGAFGVGTRSELGVGVSRYILADNYSWNNTEANYSMSSASGGLHINNVQQPPADW